MAKDIIQRIKFLKIMEILRSETDEQHPIKRTALAKKIRDLGMTCDPRTLSKDIDLLNEQGYEVMSVFVGHDRCFYVEECQI